MSTKIYTGIKFRNPDLRVIRDQLMALQPAVQEITGTRLTQHLAHACAAAHNGQIKSDTHGPGEVLATARDWLYARLEEADKSASSNGMDFKFQVTVFPCSKGMLGMYFTEQGELANLLLDRAWCREYGYYDNADRPDSVTARQWRERRKLWDEVFEHSWTPSNCGFSMNLHQVFWAMPHISIYAVLKCLRSKRIWPGCKVEDLVVPEVAAKYHKNGKPKEEKEG